MILAKGEIVWLRRRTLEDVPLFLKWRQMNGQAKLFDAPWEKDQPEPDEEYIARITKSIEVEKENKFGMAIIIDKESTSPIGTVNCYADKGNQDHKYVGLAIYEDSLISKGLGTEALKLWIDHLFQSRNLHHIGIETWSFNKRMIRVAEKLGFKNEGSEREIREWNGEWLDKLHFGILKVEWQILNKEI